MFILVSTANEENYQYKTVIYDLKQNCVAFECGITNLPLINRMLSGVCTLDGGHIYFSNHIIKIRYDLVLINSKTQYMGEYQIFDYYDNAIELSPNQKILSESPYASVRAHRFAFIIYDNASM